MNHKQEEIRKSLCGAMEIVQTLPTTLKISFATLALKLGHHFASSSGTMSDATYYFKIALNTVDTAALIPMSRSNSSSNDEEEESVATRMKNAANILELRMKAQLSLAYCYKESKLEFRSIFQFCLYYLISIQ
jgi:uncharacterized membrane protein YbjE (DUF340 family)